MEEMPDRGAEAFAQASRWDALSLKHQLELSLLVPSRNPGYYS